MAQFDNETAVIGSLMIDARCIEAVDKVGISPDDFDDERYKLAFQIVDRLRQDGKPIDPIVVADEMSQLRPGDYTELLASSMALTTTAANAGLYAQLLKDGANRKRFISVLYDAADTANYGDWKAQADTVFEAIQRMRGNEEDILSSESLSRSFIDYFERTKENPENAYCRTGFSDLDRQFGGGMFKSEVYVIGARPGMGKTTLGINIAQNVVNAGKGVLFVSLEMSSEQIQAKRISLETGIRYTNLMTSRINSNEEHQMREWITASRTKPFYLTTKNMTVGEIARKARSIDNLACVIIDYIGLISCSEDSRQKPRYEQMTEISASLKAMAKMLNVPVLALSQLNRESTTRKDNRPTMADLRDSGAIEQDAGAIVLLHRPDYYATREGGETPEFEEIELNVAKNRHAEPGLVRMWWQGNIGRIALQTKGKVDVPTTVSEEDELPF